LSIVAQLAANAIRPAPPGWSPQSALYAHYPKIAELARRAIPELRTLEVRLDHDEALGRDTRALRQAIGEAKWRLQYTGDATAAEETLARLRSLALAPARTAICDEYGSFGVGTQIWFLKLTASVDTLLGDGFTPGGDPPRFLDRINNPERLDGYFESLRLSRLAEDGMDRRKELNLATADLVRLILRRRPRGYPWDPRLEAIVRRFVVRWQDPATGFFGADYEINGERWRTADLSMTFHMARYFDGRIDYWPQLIDTLLCIRDERYPNGWLDEDGLTSHNNYDVAVLFAFGWPRMSPQQRCRAQAELSRLVAWCRQAAIASDGTVVARAQGESLPESYYFTVAFLDTVGFFDARKRFWTGCGFAGAECLRRHLAERVHELHNGHPMVAMALARLGS
jgi:hypothetical protein